MTVRTRDPLKDLVFSTIRMERAFLVGHRRLTDAAFDRVRGLVARHFEIDPSTLSPETSFVTDLEADSLDMVEVVMIIEEEFGIQIADEDAEKIVTLADAQTYLEKVRAL